MLTFSTAACSLSPAPDFAGQAGAEDRAVDAARLSLQLSQNKYGKGASTYLDVLDAQRTLLQYEQTSGQLVGQPAPQSSGVTCRVNEIGLLKPTQTTGKLGGNCETNSGASRVD